MIPDADAGADIEAMLRLQQGHDLALNELMTRWQKPLVSFLFRQLGNEEEALDLAQETFVRVFESRHRYKPEAKFSTWLFTIANNLCRNLYRWQTRHPTVPLVTGEDAEHPGNLLDKLAADSETPCDSAQSSELAAAVREQIQLLPLDLRTVLLLFEYEDMSHQEIAAIVGCTPKAVETRLYRARNILREKLSRWAHS